MEETQIGESIYKKKYNSYLGLIFLLTIFSGAIRKWIFTEGGLIGNIIQLIQLIIPFVMIFSVKDFIKPWRNQLFALYMVLLFGEALNPLNLTFYHGAFGIVLHLGFWFVLYHYLLNRDYIDLRPLIPLIVFICFGEIILAFIQYQLPGTHFLNRYADAARLGGKDVATVGNAIRVTGTFSYISGFTALLIFIAFFSWALIKINYNFKISSFLIVGNLVATLMSGSRSAMLIVLSINALMFVFEFTTVKIFALIRSTFVPVVLLVLVSLLKGGIGVEDKVVTAYDNFEKRVTSNIENGEQSKRLSGDLFDIANYKGDNPIVGVGLGSTYQGATALFGTSTYVLAYGYYEGELPRIVLEGGFILLLFRLILLVVVLSYLRLNLFSKVILFVILLYGIPLVFNIYNAIFVALGIVFLDNAASQKE